MNSHPHRRAIVFDLDGTLIDSIPLVLDSIAHAIAPFGPARPAMEIFKKLGGPPDRFMRALVDDTTHVSAAIERMDEYHRANSHLVRPFGGVGAGLGRLRAAGARLGIWTGRDRASCDQLLRGLALDGFFSAVVCGDDLPTHKPDPEGLRHAIRLLGATPAETLFVGDADVDVLGGVASGVDTVLVCHARDVDAAIRGQCWRTVATPEEALAVVLGVLAPVVPRD